MNGLHPSGLNNADGKPQAEERLVTLEEAASLLGLEPEEVTDFIAEGKIPAYKLGGEFLRFRGEQIEALRQRVQILKRRQAPEVIEIPVEEPEDKTRSSLRERLADFVYFNSFYLFAVIAISVLLFIIFKYR